MRQDKASGFFAPWDALKGGIQQGLDRTRARAAAPAPGLGETIKRSFGDMASTAGLVGNVLGLTGAPVQALVRPAARAINSTGLTPYAAPTASLSGGKVSFTAPRALQGDEAQAAMEANINQALSGARAGTAKVPTLKPVDLPTLQAAKNAAYLKVDASGFKFPTTAIKPVAKDIIKTLKAEGGADLYPDAAKMAARIDRMARKDLPLSQLEKLRGQVSEQTMQPGSKEFKQGKMMQGKLDALIATSKDPAIAEARALNTRYMKMKEVTDRLESADLTATSTYAGGNKGNATRQKLRPLLDPKSPQKMRNLTKDESKALNNAVRGDFVQNRARDMGKLLDPRGLLGAAMQGALGFGSGGMSMAPSAFIGMAGTQLDTARGARNAKKLLDLISIGGVRPGSVPYAPNPTRLLSPGGAVAVGEANRLALEAAREKADRARRN